VFERFSEHGRQVIVFAQDEARSLGHRQLGSEHVLLGLLREDDDLVELLGDPADLRTRVVELVGHGESSSPGQIRFTPNAMAIVTRATAGAGRSKVGPMELALALLSLPDDATALEALRAHGVSVSAARDEILAFGGPAPAPADEPGGLDPVSLRVLETAARHAEDVPVGAEHILLALVLEAPDLAARTLGIADGGLVQERLARLLDGPEPPRPAAGGRDIAIIESALRNAVQAGKTLVTPEDILLGLLEVAPDVVARAVVDLAAVEAAVRAWEVAEDDGPLGMFHRFSASAREAIVRAADEARLLDHAYVGTEHLLLALAQDAHGVAGRVLADLHVGLGEARIQVERVVGRGEGRAPDGEMLPFTARAKRVLRRALHESFRGSEVDTGHILLGIEHDGEGVAVLVLERLGVSRGLLRRCTLALFGHDPVPTPAPDAPPSTRSAYALAEHEAAVLGQAWVGCEHLLLALVRRGDRVAAALEPSGVSLDSVLWGVIDLGGDDRTTPFRTARLVRAVATAEALAREDGRPQADDTDLLLGLVRESVGAARALLGQAADEARLRRSLGDR
jgi:ATP-dependent Clp protease ATP-binding subunit ClpA